MALVEGCKHSLEISIPVDEVESETGRVVSGCSEARQTARLPPGQGAGFADSQAVRRRHPAAGSGKPDPESICKSSSKPKTCNVVGTARYHRCPLPRRRAAALQGRVRGGPGDRAEGVQGLEVPYHDPEVTDEDVDKRIEEIRDQKAQYVNVDPRPLEDGDYAVVALESIAGVEGEPVKQDEMVLEIGGADTFEAFTENLRGLSPGDEKEFEVTYPEDYGAAAAGRQDRQVPRHGERASPQGTARAERRVRAGSGRLPQRGRTARRRPQVASSRSASTRRSRRPRTRSSTSWWTRTISRCRKSSSSGRSRTAWNRACAPWPREGVDPRKHQARLGEGEGIAAR